MNLNAGTKLGPYEILSPIGAGGMGEVYRARDMKLGRDVAIKVLPEQFMRDPDRVARFQREARVLASLNHPNIAAIYGLEQSAEVHYLVMELVPGETLAERIVRTGAVPLEESLDICSQIAEALEAAHEKGIIHRDLKPANVKLTPEGKVKVLDFGLAKAFAEESAASDSFNSNSPTVPPGASPTMPGVILGTAAYMSPEQAKGKAVDKRTDIWALGCVLYELLTGQQAFAGESVTEVLASVLKGDPDWSMLPRDTPRGVCGALRRCLQKESRERLRDAGDLRLEIAESRIVDTPAPATNSSPSVSSWRWFIIGFAGIVVAVLSGLIVWTARPRPVPESKMVTRFALTLDSGERLNFGALSILPGVALSPDGMNLAYMANRGGNASQLYVRRMDSLQARSIPLTLGTSYPIFSRDSQWIGFFATQALKKISLDGGSQSSIATELNAPYGFTWAADDTIAFALSSISNLLAVPSNGGTPKPLTNLKGENSHRWPEFLPGGKTFLFTNWITGADTSQILAQSLSSGERRVIVQGGSYPRYVPTGHLVFIRSGNLMAIPFDPVSLQTTGSAVPVVEGVMQTLAGAGEFSFSDTGTLVYVPGGVQGGQRTLVWVDRKGVEQSAGAPLQSYQQPSLSPDGGRLAVDILGDIWIYEFARSTLTRLTFDGENARPIWSPDGMHVAYSSSKGGPPNLYWKTADGTGKEEQLTKSDSFFLPSSFSPEMVAAYVESHSDTKRDIYVVAVNGDRKPRPWLQTPFDDTVPEFSPDGHWIAYVSNESGRYEVYVQPYPGPGGKWQISTDGGEMPLWNSNGRELFYRNGDKQMAVEITTQPAFLAGAPKMLFEARYERTTGPGPNYVASHDGQRFLMIKASEQLESSANQINVVLNWFEELKQKVPTGK